MISNHLSLVEALRQKANELAAQVAEFVAAGGRIEEGPASGYIPKPITYSSQMPPAPKPFVRRRVEPIAPPPITPLERQEEARRRRVQHGGQQVRIGAAKARRLQCLDRLHCRAPGGGVGALLAQGRYLGDAVADGLGGVHGIFGRIDTVQRNISQIAF